MRGSADEEGTGLSPTLLVMEVMTGGADAGGRSSGSLLIEDGRGRSGALGRKVSALASRKVLCKVVSFMNLEAVSCYFSADSWIWTSL